MRLLFLTLALGTSLHAADALLTENAQPRAEIIIADDEAGGKGVADLLGEDQRGEAVGQRKVRCHDSPSFLGDGYGALRT